MNKTQYFIMAMSNQAYVNREWVLSAFSIRDALKDESIPFILIRGEKNYWFTDPVTQEQVILDNSPITEPPFSFRDEVKLKAGEIPNLKKDITTTLGSLLVNYIALIYPFNDKIEYQEGEFNIKKVEQEIVRRLTTDPEYQDKTSTIAKDPIFVHEYKTFVDAILSLAGYSQLTVPSATKKSMTVNPLIKEKRDELLEKHKDNLDDPAVISMIEQELLKIDKDWIKGDLSEGFYFKGKLTDIARKKLYIMGGFEQGFGLEPDVITSALSEGWNVEDLPALINSLREGAYMRGSQTALGGAATKVVNRMLQNIKITEDDCGATLGWNAYMDKDNINKYVGFYYLKASKPVLITEENMNSLVGKTLTMRSPQFCKSKGMRFCKTCMGVANSENENSLAAYGAEITSLLMNLAMKFAHGVSLKTTVYDVEEVVK